MRLSARSAAAVVTVFLLAGSAAPAGAQEAGTWAGTVDQPGASSYDVIMQLDGQGGGSTDYPALSCGGALSGGPGTYFETITRNRAEPGGQSGCIDGSITVSVNGDSMDWFWSGSWQGESYTASATLTRRGGGPSAGCDTCGRALASDVAIGLSSSGMLWTYVQQSLGKYANCTRREADQCARDCWRINLADLLPNCEQFNDEGHRACVNQTVAGANGACQ